MRVIFINRKILSITLKFPGLRVNVRLNFKSLKQFIDRL